MTEKAYIVANEQQEREVLEKFEEEGAHWVHGDLPTKFSPNTTIFGENEKFPYVLINRLGYVSWCELFTLDNDEEIVYDGRKEEKVSDKYVVSQEFMTELEEWQKNNDLINNFVGYVDLGNVPEVVKEWWIEDFVDTLKTNNRLIAIIRWVNGEDVFEVEKPKKWVVRSKYSDDDGDYQYVRVLEDASHINTKYAISLATFFDTKEEAQEWCNSHQEVVEVVDV